MLCIIVFEAITVFVAHNIPVQTDRLEAVAGKVVEDGKNENVIWLLKSQCSFLSMRTNDFIVSVG